jgi:nitrogen fixation protein NifU and related proteins
MSIYQEIILDHYHNPHNFGSLKSPTKKNQTLNPSCGDKITMEVVDKSGKVVEIAFSGEGCAISMASASMLTDFAKGKSLEELKKLTPDSIISMLGIEVSASRLKCALLPLEALKKLVLE